MTLEIKKVLLKGLKNIDQIAIIKEVILLTGKRIVINTIVIICFSIVFSLICIFSFNFLKATFNNCFFSETVIIQTVFSPDGKYVAYVFESNGGATTGWIYHVSVLRSNIKLGKGSGNVYVSDMPPVTIEWIDKDVLYVKDYKNLGTTKRKEKIYNITVKFQSLQ